jgi:hypothetical protein
VAAELKFVGGFLQKRMIEWYGIFPESDVLGSNAIMIALKQVFYLSHVKNHPRWNKIRRR